MAYLLSPNRDHFKEMAETVLYHVINHTVNRMKTMFHLKDCDVENAARDIMFGLEECDMKRMLPNDDSYDNLCKCCGYVQRYATCHAALARHATLRVFRKIPFPEASCLKIVSAGGGPGNDLIGLCSAISDLQPSLEHLDLSIIDINDGWKHAINEIVAAVGSNNFGNISHLFRKVSACWHFVLADLARDSIENIAQADIVLIVKVLFTVSSFQRDCILKNIFSLMKGGAILLCVETNISEIEDSCRRHRTMKVLMKEESGFFSHSVSHPQTKMMKYANYEIIVAQKCHDANSNYQRSETSLIGATNDHPTPNFAASNNQCYTADSGNRDDKKFADEYCCYDDTETEKNEETKLLLTKKRKYRKRFEGKDVRKRNNGNCDGTLTFSNGRYKIRGHHNSKVNSDKNIREFIDRDVRCRGESIKNDNIDEDFIDVNRCGCLNYRHIPFRIPNDKYHDDVYHQYNNENNHNEIANNIISSNRITNDVTGGTHDLQYETTDEVDVMMVSTIKTLVMMVAVLFFKDVLIQIAIFMAIIVVVFS